jgi:hypothetical protein
MKRYPVKPVRHDRNERVATAGIATKISAVTPPHGNPELQVNEFRQLGPVNTCFAPTLLREKA